MKYINIPSLMKSITRILDPDYTQEHRTGSATLGLIRHYFDNRFVVTAEQIQELSNRRPDFSIEKYMPLFDKLIPYCYVEIKSVVNSNFGNIMYQLSDTLVAALDYSAYSTANHSVFMIDMKGRKIAFYM